VCCTGDKVRSNKAFPIESRGLLTKLSTDDNINAVAVYVPPDGSSPPLFVAVSDDNSVNLWDLASAKKIRTFDEDGHEDWVLSVAVFSPPEHCSLPPMVITGCDDSTAIVWDLQTGKKLLTLEGQHESGVTAIAVYAQSVGDRFGPYPAVVITGSSDKSAVIWNLETGEFIDSLKGKHTDYINAMVVYVPPRVTPTAPLNPLILTGGDDETVIVWELRSGKDLRVIKLDTEGSEVNALAVYEPADRSAEPIVITGNEDGTVNMWDLHSGEHLRCLGGGHGYSVTALAVYTPLNRDSTPFVVATSDDGTAAVWDLLSGRELRTLTGGHDNSISTVALYAPPDGSHAPLIITAGEDYHIALWDLNAQQMQRSIEGGHAGSVCAVTVYVPNNQDAPALAITGSEDQTIIVWELKSGRKVKVLGEGHGGEITALAVYNPPVEENATPLLVSTSSDQCTVVWNLLTLKKARVLKGHTGPVNALAMYTPGALVITGSDDNTANVWNVRSGKNIRTIKEHQSSVTALAVHAPSSPDLPPWVLTGSADKTVVVCDLNTGKRVGVLAKGGHSDKITAVVVHSTTETEARPTILTAGGGEDYTIIVWSSLPFTALRRIKTEATVHALAVFTPPDNPLNPEIVASGTHGCLTVWELKSGEKIRAMEADTAHKGRILSLTLYAPPTGASPALVVTGGDDVTTMIWNYKSGNRLHALEGGHGEQVIAMGVYQPTDPEKRPLLVTASQSEVIVWDINTGRKVGTLDCDASEFHRLVVYPGDDEADDARLQMPLVFAATDSSIVVWSLLDGSLSTTLVGNQQGVHSLQLFHHKTGEERAVPILVSLENDGAVFAWDVASRTQVLSLTTGYADEGISALAVVTGTTAGQDTLIVVGGCDKTFEVWSYTTRALVRKVTAHPTHYVDAFAVWRSQVIAVNGDCAQVWDIYKGELVSTWRGSHTGSISTAVVHAGYGYEPVLVTGDDNGLLTVWDLSEKKEIRTMEGTKGVTALCTSEAGESSSAGLIFAATSGRAVDVWADCLIVSDYMPLPSMVETVLDYEIARLTSQDNECAWSRIAAMSAEFGEAFWLENYRLFTNVFERQLKPSIRDSFFKTFKSKLSAVVHLLPQVLHKDKGTKKSLLEVCIDDNLPIRGIVLDAWSAALNTPHIDFVNQVFHPSTYFPTAVLIRLADRFPAEFIDFVCRIKLLKSHPMAHLNCAAYSIDHKSGLVIEGLPSKPMVDMWSSVAGYYCSKNAAKDPTKGNQPVTTFVLPLVGAADLKMLNTYVNICNTTDNLAIFESDVGITAFKYAWASFGLRIHMTTTVRYFVFIAIYTLSVFLFDRLQRADHLSTWFWAWFLQAAVLSCVLYYICDETRQFWNENKGRVLEVKERLLDRRERAKEQKRRALESADDAKEALHKPGQHRHHFSPSESTRLTVAQRRNPAQYSGLLYVLASVNVQVHAWKDAKVVQLSLAARKLAQTWEDSILRMVVKHFSGFWNLIDLSVICIVVIGTIARLWNGHETDTSRCILSVGSVLVWFKVLNFMRPFKHSGPLSKLHFVSTLQRTRLVLQMHVFPVVSRYDSADHEGHPVLRVHPRGGADRLLHGLLAHLLPRRQPGLRLHTDGLPQHLPVHAGPEHLRGLPGHRIAAAGRVPARDVHVLHDDPDAQPADRADGQQLQQGAGERAGRVAPGAGIDDPGAVLHDVARRQARPRALQRDPRDEVHFSIAERRQGSGGHGRPAQRAEEPTGGEAGRAGEEDRRCGGEVNLVFVWGLERRIWVCGQA
jgi:WD40 repeat protein